MVGSEIDCSVVGRRWMFCSIGTYEIRAPVMSVSCKIYKIYFLWHKNISLEESESPQCLENIWDHSDLW